MRKFKPGVSFSDFVVRDSMSKRSKVGDDYRERDFRRGWMLLMIVIAGFGILVVRLLVLQGFYGERYRVLSDQNRVKKIKLPAPRGIVYDRNNLPLARNTESRIMNNGIEILSHTREYPFAEATSHVTGFLGRAGESEVGIIKSLERKYDAQDLVGRSGLELQYEELLRGEDGGKLIEVDNMGSFSRDLGNKSPVHGTDLYTSIDGALSRVVLEAMGGKKGAVVVSDPNTGEIFALVSSPSFDPNIFGLDSSFRGNDVSKILDDTNLPLFNRAIGGVYPPGSTFKMVTTAAAVDSGKVSLGFTYEDLGVIKVGDFSYTNWLFTKRGRTEGIVGFEKGLAHSVDTFFYKVGEMTTPQIMADWSYKFGLGELTGIDLPGEVGGLVATPDWKEKTKREKWFLGNTYHMAIGQGDLLTTPLQVNLMTNVLATKGEKCKPHILKTLNPKLPSHAGEILNKCEKIQISKEVLDVIHKGMIAACSPGGTAFPLFGFVPQVACKTGTSEYFDGAVGKIKTHGWLTAFAPADNPTISVTVLMEGGGEGSNAAAPVVRKILSRYFNVTDTYNYAAIPQEVGE